LSYTFDADVVGSTCAYDLAATEAPVPGKSPSSLHRDNLSRTVAAGQAVAFPIDGSTGSDRRQRWRSNGRVL
jgi:hypothetical protein